MVLDDPAAYHAYGEAAPFHPGATHPREGVYEIRGDSYTTDGRTRFLPSVASGSGNSSIQDALRLESGTLDKNGECCEGYEP